MNRWALFLMLLASACVLVMASTHRHDVSWAAIEGSAQGFASAVEVAAGRVLDGDPGAALRALVTGA